MLSSVRAGGDDLAVAAQRQRHEHRRPVRRPVGGREGATHGPLLDRQSGKVSHVDAPTRRTHTPRTFTSGVWILLGLVDTRLGQRVFDQVPAPGALLDPEPPRLLRARRTHCLPSRATRDRQLLDRTGLTVGHPTDQRPNAHAVLGRVIAHGLGQDRWSRSYCLSGTPSRHGTHDDTRPRRSKGHAVRRRFSRPVCSSVAGIPAVPGFSRPVSPGIHAVAVTPHKIGLQSTILLTYRDLGGTLVPDPTHSSA